jgi:hypothetical protein
MVCAGGRAGARRSRGGAEEEEGEKDPGTDLRFFGNSGVYMKNKISH